MENMKEHAARQVWYSLFEGVDKALCELANQVYTQQARPHFDYNKFDARVQALRAMFKYRRPTECPQENQQHQTTDTFSATRTEPVKEISRESLMSMPIARTFPPEWDGRQVGPSAKSTAPEPSLASEPPASLSTEKGVV
jgi:hypothetical protein